MPTNPQPTRYRQRPNECDAIQWTGHNADALRAFAGIDFATIDPEDRVEDLDCDAQLLVEASHWVGIKPGDWVLKFEGYFIAKADVPFRAVWEPAASAAVPSAPADRAALAAEAAVERVRSVLESEAVVGRSALDYRGLITSALMADEAQQPETHALAPMFEGLHHLLATSSRDWGRYRADAWLWAVLCGWDCEEDEHDETCTHGAMEEMQKLHGWDDDTVAKARRYRAAVRAITGTAAVSQPGKEG